MTRVIDQYGIDDVQYCLCEQSLICLVIFNI